MITGCTFQAVCITVEPRLSGLFLWPLFCYEYLLVMIKIRSHILFKTTVLKSEVKASLFCFQKSKAALCLIGLEFLCC